MNNYRRYVKVFAENFGIGEPELPGLSYQGIPAWDSVGHMSLMVSLETEFEIELHIDDIIAFTDFAKGPLILQKYGVVIEDE